jgi:hypothetical protein
MTQKQLAVLIKPLSKADPLTQKLNKKLGIVSPSEKAWYKTQHEHWLGWLSSYNGPGAYGRKNQNKDARYTYNHIMNRSMLYWLCEASGIPKKILVKAQKEMLKNSSSRASQLKALRTLIPFEMVELHLLRKRFKINK